MRYQKASHLFLSLPVIAVVGCNSHFSSETLRSNASTQQTPIEVIEFESRILKFRPTRDDFTVGRAIFWLLCERMAASSDREGDAHRKSETCSGYRVNGVEQGDIYNVIELRQVAKNQFELPRIRVEFSKEGSGHFCAVVKVWFNEVTNKYDSPFYENVDDRYALVTFCTSDREEFQWVGTHARFSQNRVATLKEFKEALSEPLVIRLNQRPLSDVDRWRGSE